MKFLVIGLTVVVFVGCKNAGKNSGHAEVPQTLTCPGRLDPNQACPDAVNPTGPVKPGQAAGKPMKPDTDPINNMITGTCEMKIKGDPQPRTCEELRLTVTSIRNNDVRHAQISGFDVKFTDLNEKAYRFVASSEKYWVKAKTGELSPGQSVKIQVIARPRTHK